MDKTEISCNLFNYILMSNNLQNNYFKNIFNLHYFTNIWKNHYRKIFILNLISPILIRIIFYITLSLYIYII